MKIRLILLVLFTTFAVGCSITPQDEQGVPLEGSVSSNSGSQPEKA